MEAENKSLRVHGQEPETDALPVNSESTVEVQKHLYPRPDTDERNEGQRSHGNMPGKDRMRPNHTEDGKTASACADCCACGAEISGHEHDGCACGHEHGHEHDTSEKDAVRSSAIRFAVSALLLITALLIPASVFPVRLAFFIASYFVSGLSVLLTALRNIIKGKVFDENFLMTVATVGAFALQKYPEAVSVMLFYNIGEMLSDIAVGHSRKSIAALMDLKPETATRVNEKGNESTVSPAEIAVGEYILVRPGERIPLDGVVREGEGFVDNAALTGESVPVPVAPGQTILSGGVCGSGLLKIRVTARFADSTVSRILEMTQKAADKKARTERFLTRFAAKYTPCVVIGALLIAVLPPLLGFGSFGQWVYRALTVLVVSCPCALVLSVPLGFFGGIGRASKLGVLVKGGESLEALAKVETVVFDKTGTLTTGKLHVQEVLPVQDVTAEACLALAASAEQYSGHPAASAVMEAYRGALRTVTNFEELPGRGVRAVLDGKTLLVGNRRLLQGEGIHEMPELDGTVLFLAFGGRYVGAVRISDTVREEAKRAIARLRAQGIRRAVMLTGDTMNAAQGVAESVGIDTVYASLMPGDKVERMEEILKARSEKRTVAYVGDGINDAPVLKTADVGIAMGGAGTDAAVEAADIVIMTDHLERVADAVHISRRTKHIILQNITFALGIKMLVLLLTFFGLSEMWEAVFADVGVTVLTVLNAARILKD